jgi:hypothetical protein
MWTKDSSFELGWVSRHPLYRHPERSSRKTPCSTCQVDPEGNPRRRAVVSGEAGSRPCGNRVALIHIPHAACARPAGIAATAA